MPADLGKIAYVRDGDIWLKALPDGNPRRLTNDSRNTELHWAPSGEWLAFRRKDQQVWVTRVDGTDARALNDGAAVVTFAWAPTEDRLAYVVGEGELRLADVDSANRSCLLVSETPSARVGRIAWSPDGARVAYEWQEQNPSGSPDKSLRMVSVDEGPDLVGGPLLVGWTGDGRTILLQDDMGSASLLADGSPLYALPADGGTVMPLARPVLPHSDFVVPDPSSTGRVAVVVGGSRQAWENKTLHVVGSSVPSKPLTWPETAVSWPAWSPDGQRLTYVTMPNLQREAMEGGEPAREGLMQGHLRIMDVKAPRSSDRAPTDDPAYRDERPLSSADGSYILFARMDGEERTSLWLIEAANELPRQLVSEQTTKPEKFGHYGHIERNQWSNW
jgi:dipeptidyl aminopeptidase/acylaminoacyl peptidase